MNEPVQIFSSAAISAPLFFRPGRGKDGPLVPSVITLEAHLDALPAVVTNSTVVEHLIAGAALFAAGVDASTLPETTAVGSLVAVCLRDGSVQAVGTLEQSRGELMRNDRQGKAVNTVRRSSGSLAGSCRLSADGDYSFTREGTISISSAMARVSWINSQRRLHQMVRSSKSLG